MTQPEVSMTPEQQLLAWIDGRILERDTIGARKARAAVAELVKEVELVKGNNTALIDEIMGRDIKNANLRDERDALRRRVEELIGQIVVLKTAKFATVTREYADRLDAVTVSDALAKRLLHELVYQTGTMEINGEVVMVIPEVADMQAALESILPIADEQAKDAERWRKLCSLIDVEAKVGTFEIEYQIGHVGEYTNVSEPILDGAQLTERVDRAIASAKEDDK